MPIDYPFHLDHRHRTAEVDEDGHLRDLIEQVLFTSPGERVQRPDFGAGVDQLVFGPSRDQVAATAQSLVQGAVQQWLGDRLRVERVDVVSADERLTITVVYARLSDRQQAVAVFEREMTP